MTAREYLTQARMIDSRINSKLMELQRARELATKATGLVSDMPRTPSPDLQQMESRVVKIVDLEREINAEIDELVDLKRDIRELIAQIRKPEYRTLLELRYLGFKTWDAIAEEMADTGRTLAANVRSAVQSNLNGNTLRSAGINVMAGLRAGILAGRSGVFSAMRSAAREAVNAAKKELKIKSPSQVFRDEVGVMTMRGFGAGVLKESRE